MLSEKTKMASDDKYRVQLDFSAKAVAELEELKDLSSASTRAEVIRNSLRWLYWCTSEVKKGGTILMNRDGKTTEVVFPYVRKDTS